MSQSKHTINWFEIPVTNISRASKFYSQVFDVELATMEFGPFKMAVFPGGDDTANVVHGALIQGEHCTPSQQGSLLYLNAGNDLAVALGRVQAAGGKVLQDKTQIGEHGYMALFLDTEGNRLAMHSMK